MKLTSILIWFFVAFCSTVHALASVEPIVKAEFDVEEVAVGEAITLTVTVLSPTWFPKPPVYPSFELTNAITRLPSDSSYSMSEQIDGENWSGIVREYQIFPLVAATYQLGDQSVRLTYADPETREPITVDQPLTGVAFTARVPTGAEGLNPYLGGQSMSLRREIEGDMESLKVGDALVVHYIAEIDGMPALFLPPLLDRVDDRGISIYADQPIVEDGSPAKRTETLNVVFNYGGEYSLPALKIDWWNTVTQAVESAVVPEVKITVSGPKPETANQLSGKQNYGVYIAVVLFFLFAVLAVVRLYPWLQHKLRTRLLAYRKSEPFAFKQLRRAVKNRKEPATYQSLLNWMRHFDRNMTTSELSDENAEGLGAQLESLKRGLYANSTSPIDWKALDNQLINLRRHALRKESRISRSGLPALNP